MDPNKAMFSPQVHFLWKLQLTAPTEGFIVSATVLEGMGGSSADGDGPTLGSPGPPMWPVWQPDPGLWSMRSLLPLYLHSGGASVLTAGQKIISG